MPWPTELKELLGRRPLLGKLAKGTEAPQRESRELWAAVRATQATLKALIESMPRYEQP